VLRGGLAVADPLHEVHHDAVEVPRDQTCFGAENSEDDLLSDELVEGDGGNAIGQRFQLEVEGQVKALVAGEALEQQFALAERRVEIQVAAAVSSRVILIQNDPLRHVPPSGLVSLYSASRWRGGREWDHLNSVR
jgi:hypothetical protein